MAVNITANENTFLLRDKSTNQMIEICTVFYILVLKTWFLDVECLFQKESEMADRCPLLL